jgi:hypothetical protein
MSTTIRNRAGDKPDDRDIDVLLAKDLPNSIVDSLFALPETDAGEATALDRAVVSRLQRALAEKMRSIVEGDERRAA